MCSPRHPRAAEVRVEGGSETAKQEAVARVDRARRRRSTPRAATACASIRAGLGCASWAVLVELVQPLSLRLAISCYMFTFGIVLVLAWISLVWVCRYVGQINRTELGPFLSKKQPTAKVLFD